MFHHHHHHHHQSLNWEGRWGTTDDFGLERDGLRQVVLCPRLTMRWQHTTIPFSCLVDYETNLVDPLVLLTHFSGHTQNCVWYPCRKLPNLADNTRSPNLWYKIAQLKILLENHSIHARKMGNHLTKSCWKITQLMQGKWGITSLNLVGKSLNSYKENGISQKFFFFVMLIVTYQNFITKK